LDRAILAADDPNTFLLGQSFLGRLQQCVESGDVPEVANAGAIIGHIAPPVRCERESICVIVCGVALETSNQRPIADTVNGTRIGNYYRLIAINGR
jgi:hypothetical protein